MVNQILIDGRAIDDNLPSYISAEMSANRNGSIDTDFRIIEAAKQAGVDAIKLQTYKPDSILANSRRGIWNHISLAVPFKST